MSYKASNEKRVQFYLGRLATYILQGESKEVHSNKFTDINMSDVSTISDILTNSENKKLEELYYRPCRNVFSRVFDEPDKILLAIAPGDNRSRVNPWKITKIRGREFDKDEKEDIEINGGYGVLFRSLNEPRHWGPISHVVDSFHWKDKKNILVWRGVTTGNSQTPGNRFLLMNTWFLRHTKIDIAFVAAVQGAKITKEFLRQPMSPSKMLSYKYILSVEGNDKDSGLNWKLCSNSVVLMPKPNSISWLMESNLVPYKHFVPVADDFSDLLEKIFWCDANEIVCLQIVQNANQYMHQFKDLENEEAIENEVARRYVKCLYDRLQMNILI